MTRNQAGRLGVTSAALLCLTLAAACGSPGPSHSRPSEASSAGPASPAAATSPAPGTVGSPPVKHADFLAGVSCTSRTSCLAAGSYYYGASGPQHPLVERWDGTSWQVQSLPADARDGVLTAISCAGAGSCTAVGSPVIGWNGSRWSIELRSSPFTAVSCPALSSCVAVGTSQSGTPEAGAWNGRRWRVGPMAGLPGYVQSVTVAGVSCWAPTGCLAVGDYSYGATAQPTARYRDRALAEYWNGVRWEIVPPPDVARRDRLIAVSCAGPRSCLAVGSVRAKLTLAERWNGGSWHVQRAANFGRLGYNELTGVSCWSVVRCVAVGSYSLGVPFADIYNGQRWRLSLLPAGPRQAITGPAVSCVPAWCEAAGSAAGVAFTAGWDGLAWRPQPTPNPR